VAQGRGNSKNKNSWLTWESAAPCDFLVVPIGRLVERGLATLVPVTDVALTPHQRPHRLDVPCHRHSG